MSAEKRKCERSDILLTVEFKEPGEKNGHSLGITRNFSPEGLSFDSQNYDIGPGSVLECTLRHHYSDWTATVRGEIIWKKESWYKCMTGLKFIDPDEEFKNKTLEFISLNKKAPEPPLNIQDDEALKEIPALNGTSREAEPATSGAVSDIADKEIIGRPGTEETLPDDIRTMVPGQKQKRKTGDRRIRNGLSASAPGKKMIWKVLLVIAGFTVISAGTLFFMFEMSETPDSGHPSPPINGGNTESGDLSARLPVPEQPPATPAEDNIPENDNILPEPPAAGPVEKHVEDEQTAREPAVQRSGDDTKQPSPEPGSIARPDTADRHAENTVSIDADVPPVPDVKKPEKAVKEIQPDIKQVTEPVTEIKDKTSKEIQGSMPEHTTEDKTTGPSTGKIRVYEDTFNDNANDWDIFTTTMASARIELGEYYIQNKRKTGAHIILHHADFPFDSDFTLEVSMRLVKSSGFYSYGIVLGARDALNNHTFQISAADSFSVRQYHEGISRELKGGKIVSPGITLNSLNVLKVVKQGDAVRFYINDIFVNEIHDLSFTGKKVGFLVDGESEIAVDRTRSRIVVY